MFAFKTTFAVYILCYITAFGHIISVIYKDHRQLLIETFKFMVCSDLIFNLSGIYGVVY